jgi:integrase
MAKKLTTKAIENLKPGLQRREISDHANGLFLLSQPSGARSFAVRYRYAGKPIKMTIGQWPAITLADARKAAADAQHELARGNNPAKARQDAKIKADATKADTLTAVCENYLKREGGRLRTIDQRVSILRRLIYPMLGGKPIGSIKRSDLVAMLDRIEDHNGPRAADVALAVLRRVMNWHAVRDDEFRSPIVRGMNRQKPAERRRERVLDDRELQAVWLAASADTAGSFGPLVKFLLLSSARRNEVARMQWDEVDANGIWTLPASRSKTGVAVVRPLSKAAQAILAEQPRIGGSPHVFTSATGRTPICQFSGPKKRLDDASGVRGWVLHDARRTARSLMSRAGIDVDVAERLLGHSRGDLRERYDRHTFLPEMTRAVEALAAQIERIVNPPEGDVADMAAERSKRRR